MAVTGRSAFARILLLLLTLAMHVRADESADLRRRLSDVATALASGNPMQAMDCFDKASFTGYDKLNGYFQGLTDAFQVDSQIEVTNEEGTDSEAKLNVHWVLTLTDEGTNLDSRREADMIIKLVRKKSGWQIVAFTPMEIFDPQMKR